MVANIIFDPDDILNDFNDIDEDNNKYKDAIGFYEPIVKKHYENVCYIILNVDLIYEALNCIQFLRF